MALQGGRYGDGAGGSASASALATVAAVGPGPALHIVIKGDDDNSGSIYLGPSTVAAAGTGAWMRLKAGQTITIGPGEPFYADLTKAYVRGSDANQIAWVTVVLGGSRSSVTR